jgi:hypothetical protein
MTRPAINLPYMHGVVAYAGNMANVIVLWLMVTVTNPPCYNAMIPAWWKFDNTE